MSLTSALDDAPGSVHSRGLEATFESYAAILANEMYRQDSLVGEFKYG